MFNVCSIISIYYIYKFLNYEYSVSQGILIGILTAISLLLSTIARRIAFLKLHLFKDKLVYMLIYLIQKKIIKLKLALT